MRDDIKINSRALAHSRQLIDVFESIYDPEIELDIYNLGMIYAIDLDEDGTLNLDMTFTSAGCACIETMPKEIEEKVTQIEGINSLNLNIVWTPAWKMNRISRVGRITLGISPN